MIGKWIVYQESVESDHYRMGQIVEVFDEYLLVRMKPTAGPSFSAMFKLEDLLESFFFDDETELNQWLGWVEEPEDDGGPKIIKLKR